MHESPTNGKHVQKYEKIIPHYNDEHAQWILSEDLLEVSGIDEVDETDHVSF